jgi:hypothetical protein
VPIKVEPVLVAVSEDTPLIAGKEYIAKVTLTRELSDLEKLSLDAVFAIQKAAFPDLEASYVLRNKKVIEIKIKPKKTLVTIAVEAISEAVKKITAPPEKKEEKENVVKAAEEAKEALRPKSPTEEGYPALTQAHAERAIENYTKEIEYKRFFSKDVAAQHDLDRAVERTEEEVKKKAPAEASGSALWGAGSRTFGAYVASPELTVGTVGAAIAALTGFLVGMGLISAIVIQTLGFLVVWYEYSKTVKELGEGFIHGFVALSVFTPLSWFYRGDLTYEEAQKFFSDPALWKPRTGIGTLTIQGRQVTNDVGVNSVTGYFKADYFAWLPPGKYMLQLALKNLQWPTPIPYMYVLRDYAIVEEVEFTAIKWEWTFGKLPEHMYANVPYTIKGKLLGDGLAPAKLNAELSNLKLDVTGVARMTGENAYIYSYIDPQTGEFNVTVRFPSAGSYVLTFACKYQSERAYTGQWIPPSKTWTATAEAKVLKIKVSITSPTTDQVFSPGTAVTVEGTAEGSSVVNIKVDTKTVGSTKVVNGAYSFEIPAKEITKGVTTITVVASEDEDAKDVVNIRVEEPVDFSVVFNDTYFKSNGTLSILIDTTQGGKYVAHTVTIRISGMTPLSYEEDSGQSEARIHLPAVRKGDRLSLAVIVEVEAAGQKFKKTESITIVG